MSTGHGNRESRIKPEHQADTISSMELNTKANFQDFQRFQVTDIGMAADSEASLPYLIEAVRLAIPSDKEGRDRETRRSLEEELSAGARAPAADGGARLWMQARSRPPASTPRSTTP